MKKLVMMFLVLTFLTATNSMAGDRALRDALVKQGVISKEEIEALPARDWTDILNISGAVEGTLSWQENRDDEENADSTSELSLDTVELGIEAAIADWVTAEIVLLAEDLGTGAETSLDVDEATITLQKESVPVYLVVGKRNVFGVLPENFVTDPMSMDAYETKEAGLTVGLTGPLGIDLSATIYKGETMMGQLFGSGLFNTDEIQTATTALSKEGDDVQSYVLAASISPVEDKLTLGTSFSSEPGHEERNDTLAFFLSATPVDQVTVNVEYFMATEREEYYTVTAPAAYSDTFKESVLFAEVILQPIDAVTLAVKYEHFDDDNMSDKSNTWSVKDRYSAAVFWTFFENENLNAFTGVEYRHSEHEVDSAVKATVADDNNEFFAKLGIGF